jgi:hypothetical protein
MSVVDPERIRLEEARTGQKAWRKWGPYLSERQWGTVREDYSHDGNAWDYFPHDHARSRAYRWGEDGLAGFSDDKQRLCFCLGLWNGNDPILKERLFGLTNSEGNHGEDVKEYYFYLDSTPTHSYAKFLYKYPQRAYPYDEIVLTNRKRTRTEQEYELIDTGVFDDDRYFDVFVEYAKDSPDDLLIQITVCNRGPEAAKLHVLPQWWFRNTWASRSTDARPSIAAVRAGGATAAAEAQHPELGRAALEFEGAAELLFTENETNEERVFGRPNAAPYVKDAFDRYLVHGKKEAVNPERRGTKLGAHYELEVPAKGQVSVKLRLRGADARSGPPAFGAEFDAVFQKRRRESDDYYASLMPPRASDDERNVIRQSLAGMLWSKQYYYFSLDEWLAEHGHTPLLGKMRPGTRNAHWFHMHNDEIISKPDKWE